MKINRRQFIQAISAGIAGTYALDPEKLLWIPGQKTIFLPPARELIWASLVSPIEMNNTLELVKNLPAYDKILYDVVITDNLIQLYYGYTK